MNKLFEFTGGREMFFALFLFVLSTVFLLINKADFTSWGEFVMWIFGIYAVGNGAEHISKRSS